MDKYKNKIRDILIKQAETNNFYKFISMIKENKILNIIIPEIYRLKFVKQDGDIRNIHLEADNVLDHTLLLLKHLDNFKVDYKVKIAGLLHDVGKLITRKVIDGKITFYEHDKVGYKYSKYFLTYYNFKDEDIEYISNLINDHILPHKLLKIKNKKLIKFCKFINYNRKYINDLFLLAKADTLANYIKFQTGTIGPDNFEIIRLERKLDIILNIINEYETEKYEKEWCKKYFLINGHDVMEILNLKPGKIIGKILNIAKNIQKRSNTIIEKEKLLKQALNEYIKNKIRRLNE